MILNKPTNHSELSNDELIEWLHKGNGQICGEERKHGYVMNVFALRNVIGATILSTPNGPEIRRDSE